MKSSIEVFPTNPMKLYKKKRGQIWKNLGQSENIGGYREIRAKERPVFLNRN